jgi:hypothetical protein
MSFVSCLDVFTFSEGFESLYTSIAKSYSVYIYIYIYICIKHVVDGFICMCFQAGD